jgi:hypothetical protein
VGVFTDIFRCCKALGLEGAMSRSTVMCKGRGLPSRIALLLGIGALSAGGAQANVPDNPDKSRATTALQGERAGPGGLVVRSEAGRILISEGGKPFEELYLADTPEALLLKQLLERAATAAGPAGVRINPTILAGSGGGGFHWGRPGKIEHGTPQDAVTEPRQPANPENAVAPSKSGASPRPALPTKAGASGANTKG